MNGVERGSGCRFNNPCPSRLPVLFHLLDQVVTLVRVVLGLDAPTPVPLEFLQFDPYAVDGFVFVASEGKFTCQVRPSTRAMSHLKNM